MSVRDGMVPEWEPVEAVLLAWPHADTDWKPWLAAIEQDYVALASAIAATATPLILCRDAAHQTHIESLLAGHCQHTPKLVQAPYNDTWCRDYGPVAVRRNGQLTLLDFQFRGWGDKYDASLDNVINQRLAALWRAPLRSVRYELEGGSIETDGQGSLLSTTHCLLDSNRNTGYARNAVESLVLAQLGLERLQWISAGALLGDDTDSHIDNLVRYCGNDTLAYLSCSRRDDPHHVGLNAMREQVLALRQGNGNPYRCVAIELPAARHAENGARLPASYVNFLILNERVLVPVFDCPQDAPALAALAGCFPGKTLVPVPGGNLIRQFGGPHCATMQLPRGSLNLPF